jgi:GAF domain-containing protein
VFDLSQEDLAREEAAANAAAAAGETSPPPPPLSKRSTSAALESRFPMNAGITGYVAATGESVNIRNAYEDDRFDPAVDNGGGGFRHRTILAMPIKYAGAPPGGKVLGVFQLVNKVYRQLFCLQRKIP